MSGEMNEKIVETICRGMCAEDGISPDEVVEYRHHRAGINLDEGEPYWTGYIEYAQRALAALEKEGYAIAKVWKPFDLGPRPPRMRSRDTL